MATRFSGGRRRSTRREPPTMGKQLVNFITCGFESSAPYFVIYKVTVLSPANIIVHVFQEPGINKSNNILGTVTVAKLQYLYIQVIYNGKLGVSEWLLLFIIFAFQLCEVVDLIQNVFHTLDSFIRLSFAIISENKICPLKGLSFYSSAQNIIFI
jgi:hypothetical protein